ncbi:unnamed protein product [Closterium sp. Naga37s-1]|nr:unnamed protein product [Closterium sp. Naga37s-1]
MGAQQSASKGVKLRRRSAMAGAVTADELNEAGVDLAKAVAQSTKIQELARAQAGAQAGAAVAAGPARPAAGGAGPDARKKSSRGAGTLDLPPWEVVASLTEADWVALRAWIEAGWRCRKCSHVRDDANEHPKAAQLLQRCGIHLPKPGTAGGGRAGGAVGSSAGSPAVSGRTTPSTVASGMHVIEYASASPDNQVGYLSDTSSPTTSRTGSPQRDSRARRSVAGSDVSHDASPRFHAGSPFGGSDGGGAPGGAGAGGGQGTTSANVLGIEACPHMQGKMIAGSDRASEIDSLNSSFREDTGSTRGTGGVPPAGGAQKGGGAASGDALHRKLLSAIARAHQVYFIDKEPNGTLVFDFLLSALLDVTSSGFGFISSALLKADGTPYLKTHAMTNVAWTKELRAWYAANAHKGLVFTNMNTLHGTVVLTGQAVITNDAVNDSRSRGVPPGHPPIETFMGIPLYTGTELIGIFGLANRMEGYDEQLAKELEPLTLTIAQMIYAVNERKRRKEAELHLSSVVQVANEGIMSLSHSGHVTSMNHSARVMFGFAAPDSEQSEDVPPPPDLQVNDLLLEVDGHANFLREGLEHHAGHVHSGQGQRQDGSVFPMEVSISKGTYDTVFYVAVVRDVSEKLDSSRKLQESEERWKYALHGSELGVWDWNVRDNTLELSDQWKAMLGYAPDELEAAVEVWESLLHPDDVQSAFIDLKAHLDGRTPVFVHEQRLRCKDGSYRWLLHRGQVVARGESGEPLHFVGTHADVTDRKQTHAAVVAADTANARLRTAEAGLFAKLDHEVREPISSVLESTKALKDAPELTDEHRAAVNQIEASGRQLASVVADALDSSIIEAGGWTPKLTLTAVAEMAEAAAEAMAGAAERKGLEVVLDASPDAPPFILADSSRTIQVLVSLLSLAIQNTTRGFVRLRIYKESPPAAGAAGGKATVLVASIESPAAPAALSAAFDANQGGLLAAKKLVEAMGGAVTLVSEQHRVPSLAVKFPVDLSRPEFQSAVVLRPSAPPVIEQPLRQSRVLVVGALQVTTAAIAKQLHAWHVPHSTSSSTPEEAFLSLFPAHALPPVMTSPGQSPPTTFPDGTPRDGLSLDYDLVVVDCSQKKQVKGDPDMLSVLQLLARDRVGVVLLLSRTVARDPAFKQEVEEAADWHGQAPVLLAKPMVRPRALLEALEDALILLPGNDHALSDLRGAAHGSEEKDKQAAEQALKEGAGAIDRAARGGALQGRVLIADCNAADRKVVERLCVAMGLAVEGVSSVVRGMERNQATAFDLVLINLEMPGVDLPAVLQALQTDHRRRGATRALIVMGMVRERQGWVGVVTGGTGVGMVRGGQGWGGVVRGGQGWACPILSQSHPSENLHAPLCSLPVPHPIPPPPPSPLSPTSPTCATEALPKPFTIGALESLLRSFLPAQ